MSQQDTWRELSIGQKSFFFFYQAYPEAPVYNVSYFWTVEGELDPDRLGDCLAQIIEKHEVLRTTFHLKSGQPMGQVRSDLPLPFCVQEVGDWTPSQLEQWRQQENRTPFDLSSEVPWRWNCLLQKGKALWLSVTWHHICNDLWSHMLLMRELKHLYGGLDPFSPERPFYEAVEQKKKWLEGPRAAKQLAYWQERLVDAPPLEMPCDQPLSGVPRFEVGRLQEEVPPPIAQRLAELAQEAKTSEFTLYLSLLQLLLHRYSGQERFFVGAPMAGRSGDAFAHTVGYFVNIIAYEADFSGQLSFLQFLDIQHQQVRQSLRRKDYPFFLLLKQLGSRRDLQRPGVFQVAFGWEEPNSFLSPQAPMVSQEYGQRETWDLGSFKLRLTAKWQVTEFDLVLRIANNTNNLKIDLEYNRQLFSPQLAEDLLTSFQVLLSEVAQEANRPLSSLPLLSSEQRHRLVNQWGKGPGQRCDFGSFVGLVTDWATKQPRAPALEMEGQVMSYQELDHRSNQLARYLRQEGVKRGEIIGLYTQPALERIVALLAIQKAGAAYLPLDPSYPWDRLEFMMKDTQLNWVVGLEGMEVLGQGVKTFNVKEKSAQWRSCSGKPLQNQVGPSDLAYVIYTSGSTGEPKGVLLEHQGLVNLVCSLRGIYQIQPLSRVLQLGSLNFDISLFEIALALGSGACLVLAAREKLWPGPGLVELLAEQRVSHLFITPSSLAALPHGELPHLKAIIAGGEACSHGLVAQWGKGRRFFNAYGPTEITIAATTAEVSPEDETVPLGRPLANLNLLVLDQVGNLAPPGATGELYIGGPGLARGYLNQADLTGRRFVPSPLDPKQRLYQTGDLVRYRFDGQLLYLGRADRQIKIRGFRVEPGEIEVRLLRYPGIKQVKVIDNPPNSQLVAYYLPQGVAPSAAKLKDFLSEQLPPQLVPSGFVALTAFPLTANGKLDVLRLPLPYAEAQAEAESSPALEGQGGRAKVAQIWKKVLGHGNFGLQDNFFDVGGDSLLLVQLHHFLGEWTEEPIQLMDLFKNPTIERLAELIGGGPLEAQTRSEAKTWQGEEIAVIGMAGRFPGAANLDELWELLSHGKEGIRRFSLEELRQAGLEPESLDHKDYVPSLGWLEGVEFFDAPFFGYSPIEAKSIDPQQRIFLETAWHALEDAGCDPDQFKDSIGVFGGCGSSGYYRNHLAPNESLLEQLGSVQVALGNEKDFLCSRVAYKLNLTGPAMTVQSACSTSLVAIHQACRSLLKNECELALAGGASVIDPIKTGYRYQAGGILSPDGHCRPFDEKAQGTVPGQGVALVALMRLERALAEGYPVRAVIKGSAINNDGSDKMGFTTPGIKGQAQALRSALEASGLLPGEVGLIEAHGTATILGDPVEMAAISEVYGDRGPRGEACFVGSIKGNLGHLDSAAGVTGVIKAVLALEKQVIPGTLNFQRPNPNIKLEDRVFRFSGQAVPWPSKGALRRAAVSSFGLGGTNAHLILEEAPRPQESPPPQPPPHLLVLSAKSQVALLQKGKDLSHALQAQPELDLALVAQTLARGRKVFAYRGSLVVEDSKEAIARLEELSLMDELPPANPVGPVFLFPGQGTQYADMGRQLYGRFPLYKKNLDYCAEVFADLTGSDFRKDLFPSKANRGSASERLSQVWLTQPVLFAT